MAASNSSYRRNRTLFTSAQIEELEREFEKDNFIARPKRILLSRKLNLDERQIKVWFQNRRMKKKKETFKQFGGDGFTEQNSVMNRTEPTSAPTLPPSILNLEPNFIDIFKDNLSLSLHMPSVSVPASLPSQPVTPQISVRPVSDPVSPQVASLLENPIPAHSASVAAVSIPSVPVSAQLVPSNPTTLPPTTQLVKQEDHQYSNEGALDFSRKMFTQL